MQKIRKDEAIAIVRQLKLKLQARGVPLQDIYLFGSFVNGSVHDWSDIDIAVVHDAFLDSPGKEKARLFEEGKDLDVRIELLSFRPADFNNPYSSIAREVQEHGTRVE